MFGYIRPWKAELKVKEFTRYQSVYCGICKVISADYGQVPRLATTYDMTFLALLLLSLEGKSHPIEPEGCILHPGQKRPTAQRSAPLEFTAACAVLLSWYKFKDNLDDREKVFQNRALAMSFARAKSKAEKQWPELAELIRKGMGEQRRMEEKAADLASLQETAKPFGDLLGEIMRLAPVEPEPTAEIRAGLVFLGQKIGEWIYLIDALEDQQEDAANQRFNPLNTQEDREQARVETELYLEQTEDALDLTAQLLPYYRDAAILSNIIQQGLPAVRETIASGKKLTRI